MAKKPDKRQSFTFYRSFYEAVSSLESKEEQADLYNAIFELSLNFNEPKNENKLNKIAWTLIKPNVLTSCKNYVNGCQRKRSGGGSKNEATSSISISNSKELNIDSNILLNNNNINKNIKNNTTKNTTIAKSVPKKDKVKFDFEKGMFENITDKFYAMLQFSYPAVDINVELRSMGGWLIANPNKKKNNYERFITSWLKRCQDKGGNKSD
jgi:hypothetical protein